MSLAITHRLPNHFGCCPDCNTRIGTLHGSTLVAGEYVSCGLLSEVERLRIELEQAEDRATGIRRKLERALRLNTH